MAFGASAGMGIAGGYDAIDKLLAQRIAAKQYADQQAQRQFENSVQTRTLNQADELKRLSIAASTQEHQSAEADKAVALQDRQQGLDRQQAEQQPPGTFIPQADALGGRLMTLGLAKPQQARSAVDEGPLQPGDTGAAREQGFIRTPTQNQMNTEADNVRADNALKQTKTLDDQRATETQRHNRAMETKQPNQPNPQPQIFVGPDGQQHAVQFVGGQAKEIPLPTDYRKPNATLDTRLKSADAVMKTGEDIIAQLSDPKVAAMVGPTMGRANSLREWYGNPPPEFSDLAGEIESYALGNMGVHGMRSVQGAQQINDMLSRKHTPASLIAAIRGLNGFARNFTGTTSGPATGRGAKPTAAELIQKYGGTSGR